MKALEVALLVTGGGLLPVSFLLLRSVNRLRRETRAARVEVRALAIYLGAHRDDKPSNVEARGLPS